VTGDLEYLERLRNLAQSDGRYRLQAFIFLHEALDHTLKMVGQKRHVTGRELLEGVRRLALEKFGMMARLLLESWGVRSTEDVGEIVFLLVESSIWGRTETDSRDDFADGYDFRQAFEDSFQIS